MSRWQPRFNPGENPFDSVERLSAEESIRSAIPTMVVALDAYSHQLEDIARAVPEGTLAGVYRWKDKMAVQAFSSRIAGHVARGSVYHVARLSRDPARFQGLIKTTPGSAIEYVPDEALYINDIVVGAQYWKQGIGRRLVRAALCAEGVSPDMPVALEGFRCSPLINGWFERIGLVKVGESPEPTSFGGYDLPMDIYQTPDGIGAADVVAALERTQRQ